MSRDDSIEDQIRAVIESGGGQRDLTGNVMDGILRATGCTQKELESVLAERFTPLQLGRFGIPNVWTVQGGTARKKASRSPFH
jgi:hypothetical protein